MMVAHVDDLLWSGTAKMDEVMKAITEEFKFGTLEIGSTFSYCGRVISQEDEGIRVTYPNHAAKVKPIYLDYRRRRQRDCAVTEPEREQLRSVVGSLNWMVRVCRMDIAYEVNYYLQAIMKSATVNDLIICNNLRQEDPPTSAPTTSMVPSRSTTWRSTASPTLLTQQVMTCQEVVSQWETGPNPDASLRWDLRTWRPLEWDISM